MASHEDIFLKVRELIATNNKIDPEQITMDSTFEELNMDSLDGITVLNDMENTYNITLPNEVVTQMKTIREVVNGLHDYLANPQAHQEQTKEFQQSQIPTVPKSDDVPKSPNS
jgi:acyl carrier protein